MKTILLSEAGRRAGLRALSKEVERVCVFDHLRDKFMNRILWYHQKADISFYQPQKEEKLLSVY
ncbi:hypothetical protein [Serratia symbiotica]|uniref:hypothetical protein n=1 Tax=Serratia symbiotica TaxID=138074 RepID=UPI00135F8A42|nr:hypothetical protein [Serratia symbiotica]MBQ0955067.1 hypothetical protein [Serratia symbiotica]